MAGYAHDYVTAYTVEARNEVSGAPVFGYATFADGKTYRYVMHCTRPYLDVRFEVDRADGAFFSFRSSRRASALYRAMRWYGGGEGEVK